MSARELTRVEVLGRVKAKSLRLGEAATLLGNHRSRPNRPSSADRPASASAAARRPSHRPSWRPSAQGSSRLAGCVPTVVQALLARRSAFGSTRRDEGAATASGCRGRRRRSPPLQRLAGDGERIGHRGSIEEHLDQVKGGHRRYHRRQGTVQPRDARRRQGDEDDHREERPNKPPLQTDRQSTGL